MVEIKNMLQQPLNINLANGKSIHFLSREIKKINEEDLNGYEVKVLLDKGYLLIQNMNA